MQTFTVKGSYIPHNGKIPLTMDYPAKASNSGALALETISYNNRIIFFTIFNDMGELVYQYG